MATVNKNVEDNGELRVRTAARTISALVAIAESEEGLSVSEIATELNVSRQVIYHLLHTLEAIGTVRKVDNRRYMLGMGVAPIATGFARQVSFQELLTPVVKAIAKETGETSYAVGWMNNDIVVIASAPGTEAVHAAEIPVGTSGHAHARASGKLLLALASPIECDEYLSTNELTYHTASTIVNETKLRKEFPKIIEQGYAIDDGEYTEELCCIAVPYGTTHKFSIGLSSPRERFSKKFSSLLEILNKHSNP